MQTLVCGTRLLCRGNARNKIQGTGLVVVTATNRMLAQVGFPESAQSREFASQLIAKLPRSSGRNGSSSYAQDERAKVVLARQNRSFALLEASDDEEAPAIAAVPTTAAVPKQSKRLRTKAVSSTLPLLYQTLWSHQMS